MASDDEEPHPLENYYLSDALKQAAAAFIEDYKHVRCHESMGDFTPAEKAEAIYHAALETQNMAA